VSKVLINSYYFSGCESGENSFAIKGVYIGENIKAFYTYYKYPTIKLGEYSGIYSFKKINPNNIAGTFDTIVNDGNLSTYTFTGKRIKNSFSIISYSGDVIGTFTAKSYKDKSHEYNYSRLQIENERVLKMKNY